jgi:hypothetical protein
MKVFMLYKLNICIVNAYRMPPKWFYVTPFITYAGSGKVLYIGWLIWFVAISRNIDKI